MKALTAAIVLMVCSPVCALRAADAGQVMLANRIGRIVDAPIFLPTGEGAGVMDGMVAQLFWEGADGSLTALEPKAKFRPPDPKMTTASAYLLPQSVNVPQVTPGKEARLRLRVWESIEGCGFEEARKSLYYFGEASVSVRVGGGPTPPVPLSGLRGMILGGKEEGTPVPAVRSFTVQVAKTADHATNWTELVTLQSTNAASVSIPAFPALQLIRVIPGAQKRTGQR